MLLDNFTATLYPKLKTTITDGTTVNPNYVDSTVESASPENYSENGGSQYFNPFKRGIAFGSGTTPPRKQIIS